MRITHVLRGRTCCRRHHGRSPCTEPDKDRGGEAIPEYAHLPTVLGEGTKKLSKRDPQSNLFLHRDRGFLPEGLLNYLALLGWGIADDRDVFTLTEMVRTFDVIDVNSIRPVSIRRRPTPSAEHIRMLRPRSSPPGCAAFFDCATAADTGLDADDFATAADLVQTRASWCSPTAGSC